MVDLRGITLFNASTNDGSANLHNADANDEDNDRRMMQSLTKILLYFNIAASCIGVMLNILCLKKLTQLKSRNNKPVLIAVAFGNLISLAVILSNDFARQIYEHLPTWMETTFYCRVKMFLAHTSCTLTNWLWFTLAGLRFAAVFFPYAHMRCKHINFALVVSGVVILCSIMESWTLVVINIETTSIGDVNLTFCSHNTRIIDDSTFQTLVLFEMFFSYFIPFCCVVLVDVTVFVRIYIWTPNDAGFMRRVVVADGRSPLNAASCVSLSKRSSMYGDANRTHHKLIDRVSSKLSHCSTAAAAAGDAAHGRCKMSTATMKTDLISPNSNKEEIVEYRRPAYKMSAVHSSRGYDTAIVVSGAYEKFFRLRKSRTFKRLIMLTLLNLSLNLPNHVIRLLTLYDPSGSWLPFPYNGIAQKLSYSISYLHYTINYVYSKVLVNSKENKNASFQGKTVAGNTAVNVNPSATSINAEKQPKTLRSGRADALKVEIWFIVFALL
uniref:G-protein coupled receptors family 1 profile domain-containing protein n=1 Tax=Romanomermis culicivorax TaxID=13658 RepID=A0A915KDT3_ROMCU